MLALITATLKATLSPSYRAARLALRIERDRRIGYARHLARKAMERAALAEWAEENEQWLYVNADGDVCARVGGPSRNGPGFLPRVCWSVLPLFGRTFRGL